MCERAEWSVDWWMDPWRTEGTLHGECDGGPVLSPLPAVTARVPPIAAFGRNQSRQPTSPAEAGLRRPREGGSAGGSLPDEALAKAGRQ